MTLNKEAIYRDAEKIYHPGKERDEKERRVIVKL
jgi:hypothetical protein